MDGDDEMRVMVVDDHQTFAELLAEALGRQAGVRCVAIATTATDAVRLAREATPDVVIMDVELPDGDGFAATTAILEDRPETRVIVLTAHTDLAFVQRAERAGATAFLPKDGSLADMLDTLYNAVPGTFECRSPVVSGLPDVPVGAGSGGRARADGTTALLQPLTPRESDVLTLMARGHDVRAISVELGVTELTCRGYVKSILSKLGVHSQLQAVVVAWRLGLVDQDGRR